MFQSKDIAWLNGYKNKTHIYPAYKRLTSDLKTQKTESEGMEKVFHANGNLKKARIAILLSDKTYFKIKAVTKKHTT